MKRETIDLKHGRIEVATNGNLIYLKVYGKYTDADVIAMTRYLENFFNEIGGPTIRIWDASNIASDQFKLTTQGIDSFKQWAERMKRKWPKNEAYFISNKPLIFGISRMYELKTSDKRMPISVVKSIDELPDNIKERIPRIE